MHAELNQHLQDCLLWLAIQDETFLGMVAGRIEPRHLTSEITEDLVGLCIRYWERHKKVPGDHFHDEVVRLLRDYPESKADEYATYIQRVQGMPAPNREYVLHRLDDFVRLRVREIALLKAAEHLRDGKLEEHDLCLYNALRSGLHSENEDGCEYFRSMPGADDADESVLFPTGIRELDRHIQGYKRKQLVMWMGGVKAGKSWALLKMLRSALRHGLRAVLISLEMTRRETVKRTDMGYTRRATRKQGEMFVYPRWDAEAKDFVLKDHVTKDFYELTPWQVAKARMRAERLGGRVFLKKYPMGQCSPAEVERYLEYLESYKDFIPDVLLIDYPDIMDLSCYGDEPRHRLNSAFIWCKGLADSRNLVCGVASQSIRTSLNKAYLDVPDVAEDIRKMANADLGLGIARNRMQQERSTGGISVLVHRDGPQGARIGIAVGYPIGQFCLSSWPAWADRKLDRLFNEQQQELEGFKEPDDEE